jgi:hypothetical protein
VTATVKTVRDAAVTAVASVVGVTIVLGLALAVAASKS